MSPSVVIPVFDLEGNRIREGLDKFPTRVPKEFFIPMVPTNGSVYFTERAVLNNCRRFVKVPDLEGGFKYQEQPRSLALAELMKRYPQ